MPPRPWRFRLLDMVTAVERILAYTAGMDGAAFAADQRTIDAVVRNLITLGEATRRIPPEVEQAQPHIPWNDIRDMRNVVVHEYQRVDSAILWDTVRQDIPPLLPALRALLRDTEPEADHAP